MLAYDYPLPGALWTMLAVFAYVIARGDALGLTTHGVITDAEFEGQKAKVLASA